MSFAETSGIISQQDGMPLKLIGLLRVDNRGRIIGVKTDLYLMPPLAPFSEDKKDRPLMARMKSSCIG